jgi:hypothetical protein
MRQNQGEKNERCFFPFNHQFTPMKVFIINLDRRGEKKSTSQLQNHFMGLSFPKS